MTTAPIEQGQPITCKLVINLISGYITGYTGWRNAMANTAHKRALKNYRQRLSARGMARFEVLGLDSDRELIRSLARRLAQNDDTAARLRADVLRSITGEPLPRGGILAALRQSPLVGAELDLTRDITPGRDIDL
jgi:hypothetical protein